MVHHIPAFWRDQLLLQSLPLLGGIALGCPSMNSSDFGLERGVDEPVSRKHSLTLELRGNNHSLESLSTSAYINPKSQNVSGRSTDVKKENVSTS